jgi:hypothetical protein
LSKGWIRERKSFLKSYQECKMTIKEFHFSESLESKGITNLSLNDNEIVVEMNGNKIKTKMETDVMTTINNVRNNLDNHTKDNKIKEELIFIISKNIYQIYELKSESKSPNEKTYEAIITLDEWKNTLLRYYHELKETAEKNFPNLWESLEFELAVKNILHINNCTLPFAGIVLGPPSSMKTLGIELFRNTKHTFYSDSFSAKSFVSHNTAVKRAELSQIDLLPKIKDKLFLTPELSPTFAKKDEELIELLGILIRILDGKGYESDAGAQGHRGYTGEHMFVWIGAAVEISWRVHRLLSTLGPKLYFFRIPKSQRSEDQYYDQIRGKKQFHEKVKEIQNKLEEYLEWFNKYHLKEAVSKNGENNNDEDVSEGEYPLKIKWDENKDEEKALRIIIKLANLLSPLRGILQTRETKDTQGTEYAFSFAIKEEPDRAITQLTNLARGAALKQGRNYITIDDLPLVVKAVLSTASMERVRILDLLLNAGGKLSASQIEYSLNISKPTAKRTMAEFKGLEIVDLIDGENINSEKTIQLKTEFSWFLSKEFKALRNGFKFDLETDKNNKDNPDFSPLLLQEKYPLAHCMILVARI